MVVWQGRSRAGDAGLWQNWAQRLLHVGGALSLIDRLIAQYRDASNLNARVRLHDRFSTNRYGWHRWVFDRLNAPDSARILELGCGPGLLWQQNAARLPADWDVTLSDRSPGMLVEARQGLSDAGRGFDFVCVDAQHIPFAAGYFDAVIANHMLYHVPDRPAAMAEIRRVLRPDGRFYAATNGHAHMRELEDLVRGVAADWLTSTTGGLGPTDGFTLENGAEQIAPWFSHVELQRYNDALVVAEPEPLLTYILSGAARGALDDARTEALAKAIDEELAAKGAVRITKDSGIFVAWS